MEEVVDAGVGRRPEPGVVQRVARELAAAGVPSPDVDARWLVRAVTGDQGVDEDRLAELVARRRQREPLQVVLGTATFRWITLAVRSGVFVPRPETEVVAGVAVDEAMRITGRRALVVDACTGTGAIALAVAAEVPGVRVVATEVDEAALALARANLAALDARRARHEARQVADPTVAGERHRSGDRLAPGATVEVLQGDVLDPLPPALRGRVDVLVANPPYLPSGERGTWEPEVADHDPDRALVGGPDGHEVVEHLLVRAATWLRPGGLAVVEVDDRRGPDAVRMARLAGLVDVHIEPDLAGRDRAVVARRPTAAEASGGEAGAGGAGAGEASGGR